MEIFFRDPGEMSLELKRQVELLHKVPVYFVYIILYNIAIKLKIEKIEKYIIFMNLSLSSYLNLTGIQFAYKCRLL